MVFRSGCWAPFSYWSVAFLSFTFISFTFPESYRLSRKIISSKRSRTILFQHGKTPRSSYGNSKRIHRISPIVPTYSATSERKDRGSTLRCKAVESPDVENDKQKLLPTTLISGFLGAGKTTLLKNILTEECAKDAKYAVIVNDMAEIGIDGQTVNACVKETVEDLVEMSNGCICCTLRKDLLQQVRTIAESKKCTHLIIESTGISEPGPVTEIFRDHVLDDMDDLLPVNDVAYLDTLVTVVDAPNFLRDMETADDVTERDVGAEAEDARTINEILVSQLEFCNIVILNKVDLVDADELQRVKDLIRSINLDVRIIETTYSNVDSSEIIGTGKFDFESIWDDPTWIRMINEHDDNNNVHKIESFVYRRRKPFHPERLMKFFESTMTPEDTSGLSRRILRSKGFLWLSSRPESMMIWSQASGLTDITPGGTWWADTPEENWPEDEVLSIRNEVSESKVGDRRQELVFIGIGLNETQITSQLDECLLNDKEIAEGPDLWRLYPDPLP